MTHQILTVTAMRAEAAVGDGGGGGGSGFDPTLLPMGCAGKCATSGGGGGGKKGKADKK